MLRQLFGLHPRVLAAAGLTALIAVPAAALEGGQSPYIKGFRDFQTGIIPVEPGVYTRIETYYYRGSAVFHAGPRVRVTADGSNLSELVSPSIVTPWQILGGTYALSARVTNSRLDIRTTTTTPLGSASREGRLQGWNDLQVTPFLLGWHNGNFHWNVAASFWLPVGAYDASRVANTGRNFTSFGTGFGFTYRDPLAGFELSAATTVLFNTENPATQYQSGRVLHIDYTVAKQLTPQFEIAAVGYIMYQLTADSGAGAVFGQNRSHVAGLGPALNFMFALGDVPMTMQLKYYREFSAVNTTQGDAASFVVRTKF